MNRLLVGIACALVVVVSAPRAAVAQATKTVKGAIVAVAPDSITVKVGDQDMKFAVDAKTQTVAPGGGTKARAAQAEGKPGVPLTEVVKVGQGVEVRYHEDGMHAANIRVLTSVPKATSGVTPATPAPGTGTPAAPASASKTVNGTVTAVTGNSLTVKGATDEWTFTIDTKTTVVGTGVGTAARKMTNSGEKTTITDFVATGDTVRVTFREMDGTKHAGTVRIVKKHT